MKLLLTTIAAVLVVGCGESPSVDIWEAVRVGNIEAVKQHLAAGADVNAKINLGTPLHYAALDGYKEVAELLIDKGADVNAKNLSGGTPLHNAAQQGHKEIVVLLIANGADLNAKTYSGQTPLDDANMMKRITTANLLRKLGGKTDYELQKAAGN